MEFLDALRISSGQATIPPEWINLLEENPSENARWKANEFRREV